MIVAAGSTNVTTYFVLRTAADGTATTGATIANIDLQYIRSGDNPSAKVDAIELAAINGAHEDNKAKEVDGTDAPGLYRVDWPDAAFAAGVREVILSVKLASSFTEHLRVELSPAVDTVAWAGTATVAGAIPAVAADAAGGLPISDAGGLDLDVQLANTNEVTAARMGALTDWINGGRLDLLLDAIPTTAMRGTDNAALAATALSTAVWTAARAGALTDWIDGGRLDLLLDAIKAVTDVMPDAGALTTIGTDTARLTAVRAAVLTDWINGERLDLLLDAIPTTAMRGTDNAALAATALSTAVWTAVRAQVLTDWINGGRLDLLLDAIPTTAMRGTDGVSLVVPDAAGIAAALHVITDALIAAIAGGDATAANQTTLLNRLTAARAALLDNLSRLDVLISSRATAADVQPTIYTSH